MADAFTMPKLGLTMEYGTIISWLVDEGADVEAGQPVLLIETDKVETEIEASATGRLLPVGVTGQEYECGATIGWFLAEGETGPPTEGPPPLPHQATAAATVTPAMAGPVGSGGDQRLAPGAPVPQEAGGRLLVSPNARRIAAQRNLDLRTITGTGPGGRIVSEDLDDARSSHPPPPRPPPPATTAAPVAEGVSTRSETPRLIPATAAARQLADLLGVDLAEVSTAAVDPRVTRQDVALHVRRLLADRDGPDRSAPELTEPTQTPSSVIAMTGMRRTIAERMSASLAESAQLTLTMDVTMDRVIGDRERRRANSPESPPSITDYVIAATAAALVEHPRFNSQLTATGLALLPEVNVGMAVALDDGLVVPVIHNTPTLDLAAIASETKRLAKAARDRNITRSELQGATFSVTALGMFGVDVFTPIINPPNVGILGVGRIRRDLDWTDEGTPIGVDRLTLSLTWDHRAIDGAPAAQFAGTIKQALESV